MENLTAYYYEQAGRQAGPVDADQLLANGVTASTLMWQEGMADWVPAATIPALAALFQPVPPPLPSRMVSVPSTTPEPSIYPPSVGAGASILTPQPAPATPLPQVIGQAVASATSHLASPAEPTARPQFSAPPSTRKWWHYVLYAIAFIFMWLLICACGTVVEHAITAAGQALPAPAVNASRLVGTCLPAS